MVMHKNKIDILTGFGKVKPGKKVEVEDDKGNKTANESRIIPKMTLEKYLVFSRCFIG